MAGVFQRQGSSVSVLTTTSVGTLATLQIGTLTAVEIANISTTASATFSFTPFGAATGVAAATTDRVIPPDTVLYEYCPLGIAFASALAVASPGGTVVFTPGQIKDLI